MSFFKNKKPGNNYKVSVSTTTKKVAKPLESSKAIELNSNKGFIENDDKNKVKKRKQVVEKSDSSSSSEDDDENDNNNVYRSNWKADNENIIERHSIISHNLLNETSEIENDIINCKDLVKLNLDQYRPYFDQNVNVGSTLDENNLPSVVVDHPGIGREEYALLIPKNSDNYSPMHDLIKTLMVIIEYFVPSAKWDLFGFSPGIQSSTSTTGDITLVRSIQRSFNRKEYDGFINSIEKFNELILNLKKNGDIIEHIKSLKGVNPKIWQLISDQSYQRVVGPHVNDLRNYQAFSSNIYGELLSPFIAHICQRLNINSNTTFVDLGSGVGNIVYQMAFATGCKAYGIEQMNRPAQLADAQLEEGKKRANLFGLSLGHAECQQGDMCESQWLYSILPNADVILVNNYAFSAQLNERLSLLFLDLKDNVKIVSLRPFLPKNFRITDATVNSPLAILKSEKGMYHSGSVSWTDAGGEYFIQTVDRTKLNDYLNRKTKKTRK